MQRGGGWVPFEGDLVGNGEACQIIGMRKKREELIRRRSVMFIFVGFKGKYQ